MARNSLPSPLESALANAPSFGLPESFKQERQQQASFTPGSVPFQSYFNSASSKYGVPVNVLMALAQQESSFNPVAVGVPTKYGRAKGLMQYIDSTAAGMGINPYDPVQSIDAAAKQLRERLDKGYSMQEAVSAHFGGDDRKQWGPKTRAYGIEVMGKAQRFFDGADVSQPGQQSQQSAGLPSADAAVSPTPELGALQERGRQIDTLLSQLNQDEPDRYRALTQEEVAQYQQQQQQQQAQQVKQPEQATLTADTPEMPTLDYSAANQTQAEAKGIADKALDAVKDAGTLLASGVNIAAKDVQELVGKIPYIGKPIVDAADRFDRWANGKSSEEIFKEWDQGTEKSLSPEMLQARKKAWVIEPGDDNGDGTKATSYSFGPAWSDPRAYASGILESLPEMAITMGGSGRLASMAYKRALAKGATREAAAKTAAKTAMFAGGILEGGLGGAQASRETREQILKMSPEQLKDSEAMASLIDSGRSFEDARRELADNAASKAFVLAGVTTGMFGGMGDRALAKIITGNSGRLKAALAGALGEGLFEEVPQSATQQMSQNYAMQDADPNTPLMKGVANQAAGGLAVGGLMGAGMGAAAPRAGQDVQPVAEVTPAQEVAQTDTKQAVEDAAVAAAPTPSRDDTGLSDDAGPLERAARGTAQQPDASNGNFWAGEPGATIQMQAKGDPQSAMVATVERYESDGGVTVRGEDGTPYTVSPDEVDITAAAAPQVAADQQMQDAGTTEEVKAERAQVEEQQSQERQAAIEQALQEQGVDPKTGEILDSSQEKPAVKEEAAPVQKSLEEMDEGELRDRMRYLATQAKTNGGWDKRLTEERRKVERVLDAKVQAAKAPMTEEQPAAQPADVVLGADGTPKWFSTADKAAAHIEKKGLTGYAPQEVQPGRFQLRATTAEAPKPAAPKKEASNPRINRVKKLVGEVGQTVSPSGEVGGLQPGASYTVDRIEKNGTTHLTNKETGERATVGMPDLEVGKSRRVEWSKVEQSSAAQPVVESATVEPQAQQPEWQQFDDASGSLRVPRDQMPQIKAEHRGALVNFLNARGVAHQEQTVPASSLKATQAEFSPKRVAKASERTDGDRSILVSSDGHILDGHHQWLAAKEKGEDIKVIRLDAPISDLIKLGQEFPSSTLDTSSAQQPAQENKPAEYGANNKLVSQDRAAELRQKLKAKFAQLNSGIDPEILAIGTELAVFHIEASARKFADFAKAMAADLDMPMSRLRPYLRSWYNGARDMMEDSNVSIEGMDSPDAVRAALAKLDQEPAEKPAEVPDEPQAVVVAKSDATPKANRSGARPTPGLDAMVAEFDAEVARNNAAASPAQSVAAEPKQGQEELAIQEGETREPSTPDAVERDGAIPENAMGEAVGATQGSGSLRDSERAVDAAVAAGRVRPVDGSGVPATGPLDVGTSGDQRVPDQDGQPGPATGVAGTSDPRGNRRGSGAGVQSERQADNRLRAQAQKRGEALTARQKQQAAADKTPVTLLDAENIKATLPLLSGPQQGDVLKAELRLYRDGGKGIMLTNGTGTGKTYSGLGVAKRVVRRGGDVLIVSPAGVIPAWVKGASDLGMTATPLKNKQDAGGQGVSVTSYQNFSDNQQLIQRNFDLVIYDESHHLMANMGGDSTAASLAHKAMTGHPDYEQTRGSLALKAEFDAYHADALKEVDALVKNGSDAVKAQVQVFDSAPFKRRYEELSKRAAALSKKLAAEQQAKNTKVVFLSASPFAGHKSVFYTDGYLFDSKVGAKDSQAYNTGSPESQYLVSNFGYRMRYNRVTQPGPEVDVGLLERDWADRMFQSGAMTGRKIELDHDYSREFVTVAPGIGEQIDKAFETINWKDYPLLSQHLIDWRKGGTDRQLTEALRAKASLDRIEQHLKMGRKVVVFHERQQLNLRNPFKFNVNSAEEGAEIAKLKKAAPWIFDIELGGLTPAPDAIGQRFGSRVGYFSGLNKNTRDKDLAEFNKDGGSKDILVIQKDAGKEGLSAHDITGKSPRALMILNTPVSPADAIQMEGRTYRHGLRSDAIIEYPTIQTSFEKTAYRETVSSRTSTAENLAMGSQARNLREAFREGYLDPSTEAPSTKQGKGGRQADSASEGISMFDRAKTYYFRRQKKTSKNKAAEGADYFATPEPLGQKMVEWANLEVGEKALEPSGGHGAIARWLPESTSNLALEPSPELVGELGIVTNGDVRQMTFEELNQVNKFHAVVMNPPFGQGGSLAIQHIGKAVDHLKDGGRVIAVYPKGPAADAKFDKWFEERTGVYLIATIDLPSVTFNRAGTSVGTRILVLDKDTRGNNVTDGRVQHDLTGITDINELFARIEHMQLPARPDVNVTGRDVNLREERFTNKQGDEIWRATMTEFTTRGPAKEVGLKEVKKLAEKFGGEVVNDKDRFMKATHFDFATEQDRERFFAGVLDASETNKGKGDNLQAWARLTSDGMQATPEELEKLQGMLASKELPVDDFAELVARIERLNRNATSNPQRVLNALRAAEKSGEFSAQGMQLAHWLIREYPHLANSLSIEVAKGDESKPAGNYNVSTRLITLFSNFTDSNGNLVNNADLITATHEIMHHLERMLPRDVQEKIADQWLDAMQARMKEYAAAGETEKSNQLADLVAGMYGDKPALERARKALMSGDLPSSDYQYASPSEYWAENGARIIAERKAAAESKASGSWVDKAVLVMRSIIDRIKKVLGRADAKPSALEAALDGVLAGDGQIRDDANVLMQVGDQVYGLTDKFAGDYQPGDLPQMRSGMKPDPEIPTEAQDNARLRSWWDRFKNAPSDLTTDAMQKGLALIPFRPLVQEMARNLPAAAEYLRLKQSMDAMRSRWHAKTDETAQAWLKYRKDNATENVELMNLMHEATIARVDPSEDFESSITNLDRQSLRFAKPGSEKEKELLKKVADDKAQQKDWEKLKGRYDALSPQAREIFNKVRDAYTSLADEYEKVLLANMEKAINVRIKKAEREHRYELQRIEDEGLAGEERKEAIEDADHRLRVAKTKTAWNRKARITQLRQQFEMNRLKGPYFPLARFGNLFVTVRDAKTGKVESFSKFEKAAEQREFAELMRKDKNYRVQVGTLDDSGSLRKAVDPNFVADVEDILADLPNAETVKDEVWQRYLESLPDFSVRKNRIHRTGRAGFNADALRAFGNQMFHGSHQLARLAHSFDMEEALDASREEANTSKDPVRDGLVVNELEKRHEFIMNPTGGPLVQKITQAAFIYALAASPKAALVNLSQTVIMGIPILASYDGSAKGVTRAANQLTRALADFTAGKGKAENSKRLTADERKAMQEAYDNGLIDRTQSHDLAGIGETGVEYSPARTKVMSWLAWGFHHTERLNREVTYLAAYRMARAKGLPHVGAVMKAGDLTWKTHFDYQNTSRPRIMHNDTMKALLVFRNFTINMLYRLFRDIHQAANGDTPEVRREAKIQLAGITGMMMLSAGITGTWGFGIMMVLASAFMEDDKDPEAELKKNMVEALGPMMAGIILDGVPGYATGTSLSDSIGMRDLWFRSPSTQLEGKDEADYWKAQLLGAAPSMVDNIVRGYGLLKEGQTYRGIETMMPKAIKDPMKAFRYSTEGATNKRGDTLVENIDTLDIIRQALGFVPAKIAEQYDINNAGYNLQQSILRKRQALMDAWWKAEEAGEEAKLDSLEKDIDAYNDKYPEQEITPKTLRRSASTREDNAENATGGMRYNRKLRDRILEEQAPAIYR